MGSGAMLTGRRGREEGLASEDGEWSDIAVPSAAVTRTESGCHLSPLRAEDDIHHDVERNVFVPYDHHIQ